MAGLHAAVLEILEARFNTIPTALTAAIQGIGDPTTLHQLVRHAALADSLETFESQLPES